MAGGEWLKVTLGTMNKEMSCSLCMRTGPSVLQTPPPAAVLVPEESCPCWWPGTAASLSCFSGFGTGCSLLGDCSLCWEGGQGTSALSTVSGVHALQQMRAAGWEDAQGGELGGAEDLDPEAGVSSVCWGAAEQHA